MRHEDTKIVRGFSARVGGSIGDWLMVLGLIVVAMLFFARDELAARLFSPPAPSGRVLGDGSVQIECEAAREGSVE